MWTATHQDLALSGLAPAACRPGAHAVDSINTTTGVFRVDGHGFNGGEPVRFAIGGDYSSQHALPTGISADVWYIVAPTNGDPDYFMLTPPLVPSDVGAGSVYVAENYVAKIDQQMAAWTSVLLAKAVAYKPPWITPPAWAPMMVAKLAAPTVASVLRVPSDRYPVPDIAAGYEWAQKELAFLASGGIYNDGTGPIDSSANSGTAAAARARSRCPVPWQNGAL